MFDHEGFNSTLDVAFGAYERAVLRGYFLNSLRDGTERSAVRVHDDILEWFEENAQTLDVKLPSLSAALIEYRQGKTSGNRKVRLTRREIDGNFRRLPQPSAFQRRLDWVVQTLKLSPREALCLFSLCRATQLAPFRTFAGLFRDFCGHHDDLSQDMLCKLTALSSGTVRKIFSRRGQLMQLGLIELSGEDYVPSEMLLALLRHNTTRPDSLESTLLGPCPVPNLDLADFRHMQGHSDDVVRILRGAMEKEARGVGILLHGVPGTGKTEFAKLLGAACGARVVFVGEVARDDREPARADRLAHLSLLSAIGARAGRLVLVVDEADDILAGIDDDDRHRRTGSKVFVNRLVENSTVPTIWISNRHQSFGPAVLRRMLRAVEFRNPGADVRERIVTRHAVEQGLALNPEECLELAALQVTPAIIASSMKAARLGGGGGSMVVTAARSIQSALGEFSRAPSRSAPPAFDISLSTADIDLSELSERVAQSQSKALSFLFSGPPGTGKSVFARHLAQRLGMEVLQKRTSDLLGRYVGETEANIARAFRQAEDEGRFLIFDEADSLLLDRRGATRSWEVSQVNEMLTWMDSHPLPVAATTNLSERLDAATSRRFLFKVTFSTMDRRQVQAAFQAFFDAMAPQSILGLEGLTPADFDIAARKARLLGAHNAEDIGALIEAEVQSKIVTGRRIGFI